MDLIVTTEIQKTTFMHTKDSGKYVSLDWWRVSCVSFAATSSTKHNFH
jgi:hypothetical protein